MPTIRKCSFDGNSPTPIDMMTVWIGNAITINRDLIHRDSDDEDKRPAFDTDWLCESYNNNHLSHSVMSKLFFDVMGAAEGSPDIMLYSIKRTGIKVDLMRDVDMQVLNLNSPYKLTPTTTGCNINAIFISQLFDLPELTEDLLKPEIANALIHSLLYGMLNICNNMYAQMGPQLTSVLARSMTVAVAEIIGIAPSKQSIATCFNCPEGTAEFFIERWDNEHGRFTAPPWIVSL